MSNSDLAALQESIAELTNLIAKVADQLYQASQAGDMPDPSQGFNDMTNGVTLMLAAHHQILGNC